VQESNIIIVIFFSPIGTGHPVLHLRQIRKNRNPNPPQIPRQQPKYLVLHNLRRSQSMKMKSFVIMARALFPAKTVQRYACEKYSKVFSNRSTFLMIIQDVRIP